MFCKKCGSNLDSKSKFCGKCGHPVSVEPIAPPPQPSVDVPPPQPHVVATPPQLNKAAEQKPSNKKTWIILGSIGGVLLLGAAATFIFMIMAFNGALSATETETVTHSDDATSIQTTEASKEEVPDGHSLLLAQADQALAAGSMEKAMMTYQSIIDTDSQAVEAYIGLANCYVAGGDLTTAISYLNAGYTATSDVTVLRKADELFWIHVENKHGSDVIGLYSEIFTVGFESLDPAVYSTCAQAYLDQNMFAEAQNSLTRAVELNTDEAFVPTVEALQYQMNERMTLTAYYTHLSTVGAEQARYYALEDLNADGIPELITDEGVGDSYSVYAYRDGQLSLLNESRCATHWQIVSDRPMVSIVNDKWVTAEYAPWMLTLGSSIVLEYTAYSDGNPTTIYYYSGMVGNPNEYKVNDVDISEAEYQQLIETEGLTPVQEAYQNQRFVSFEVNYPDGIFEKLQPWLVDGAMSGITKDGIVYTHYFDLIGQRYDQIESTYGRLSAQHETEGAHAFAVLGSYGMPNVLFHSSTMQRAQAERGEDTVLALEYQAKRLFDVTYPITMQELGAVLGVDVEHHENVLEGFAEFDFESRPATVTGIPGYVVYFTHPYNGQTLIFIIDTKSAEGIISADDRVTIKYG